IEPVTGEGVLGAIKAAVLKGGTCVAGFNSDLSAEEVEEIAGSQAAAQAIIRAAEKYDVPVTEENVKDAAKAVDMAQSLRPLTAGETAAMVLDGTGPTIEGIYMAENSGNAARPVDEDIEGAGLEDDIEKAVKSAGGENFRNATYEETLSYAKEMVSYGVPLTDSSIIDYVKIRTTKLPSDLSTAADAAVSAISDGLPGVKGDLTDTRNAAMKADDLLHNEAVLARVRAKMSTEANLILAKSGFSIDTSDMEALADALEKAESARLTSLWGSDGEEAVEKDRIFNETLEAMDNIRSAPAFLAGVGVTGEDGSLRMADFMTVSEVRTQAVTMTETFARMDMTYEAVGTQVRTDLGDSMTKAFSNVDDILADLGIENSTANVRAVRILGWNSQEITAESVYRVRAADDSLNALVNKLTPAAALDLVRQGVDTVNTGVNDLIYMLDARGGSEYEAYDTLGEFVYKMEIMGGISENEKQSLIGIFRLLNQIKKHDDRSVGGILNSGRDMTLGNLFTESKSLKAENTIDVSVGEEYRGSDHETQNSIMEQIENHTKAVAEEITAKAEPEDLAALGSEQIQGMTPDALLDAVIGAGAGGFGAEGGNGGNAGNGAGNGSGSGNGNGYSTGRGAGNRNVAEGSGRNSRGIQGDLSGLKLDEEKMENAALDRVAQRAAETDGGDTGRDAASGAYEEKMITDMRTVLTESAMEEVFARELSAFGGRTTIYGAQALKSLRTERGGYLKKAVGEGGGKAPDTEGIISAFTGPEEAAEATDRMCSELEEALDERLSSDEGITYLDIQALKAARRQVSVIRQLSREEDYEVPVELNGNLTSVNVKLIHGDVKGRVYASMEPGEGMAVSSSFTLTGNEVSGYVVCTGEGMKEMLESMKDRILEDFEGSIEVIGADTLDAGRFDMKAAEEKEASRKAGSSAVAAGSVASAVGNSAFAAGSVASAVGNSASATGSSAFAAGSVGTGAGAEASGDASTADLYRLAKNLLTAVSGIRG
ncbi:MAG: DUF6240 domain-containing protein, partial [Lachnospiraceae bacterium]|nr:DUF6240 domain-containing protein [Lachnospiraceae bacterium]